MKMASNILKSVNIYKDKRVKVCTEIIEGIRFIKLYGWEIAFQKIIQELRKKEIQNYEWLSFARSIERVFGNTTSLWSSIVCFTIMYFAQVGEPLTTAVIISTL